MIEEKEGRDNKKTPSAGVFRRVSPKEDAGKALRSSRAQAKRDISFTVNALRSFVSNVKGIAAAGKKEVPDMTAFENVLEHWGLERDEIPVVKKGMVVECLALVFLIVFMFYGLVTTDNLYFFLLFCVIILASGFRILGLYWKLWVLRKERFVYFRNWITRNY